MNLTNISDVRDLMASSKSEKEWNENCDKVKAANNRKYPFKWYVEIILGGVLTTAQSNWKDA